MERVLAWNGFGRSFGCCVSLLAGQKWLPLAPPIDCGETRLGLPVLRASELSGLKKEISIDSTPKRTINRQP
jgi:hypothetical protein